MVKVIKQVSKPCIAFKVFAGNRHTSTPEALQGALRFAFENIKPNDVVLLGMWQKYKDQVAENVGYAGRFLRRKHAPYAISATKRNLIARSGAPPSQDATDRDNQAIA